MNQFDGTLIAGRYEIREHIATGGMASVFKTWDHRVERIVAMKVLRSLDKNDLRAVERFRREARAAAALTHPNAVTIYDFVEEMGQYFLVMEYIHGPTLKQLIAQRRQLQAQEVLEIAAQVCAVLQVAHVRGFIHRDIKPQNIMLARGAGSIGVGILGGGRGASSDLYSLGVVMFEMLTGRPPFVGPTAVSIAMQHASTNPPPLRQFNANVPPAAEEIVMRVLEKEPEDRFHSAAEMQEALRQCARELSAQSPPGSMALRKYPGGTNGQDPGIPPARGPYSS